MALPRIKQITGEIKPFAGATVPAGYLLCYGQATYRLDQRKDPQRHPEMVPRNLHRLCASGELHQIQFSLTTNTK